MPHALIVDDDPNACTLLAEVVRAEGLTIATAGTLQEARRQMAIRRPDIVLLDLNLPDGSGMELFQDVEAKSATEIVLITGYASVETSIEALRLGAADYLVKPIHAQQVKAILARLTRPVDLKADIDALRTEMRSLGKFGKLIGVSAPMQKVYDAIARVAPTPTTVLITGETGTGKEVIAETIHNMSRRKNEPFVPVNCGAIPAELIESEMFGHEKGSFTGAVRDHRGYFERADGGTLFLDEITEMPLELQVKLLRILETGKLMRVGSQKSIETDVRIIAATNRAPADAVQAGKLREDLFYRLNVFPISAPPLRERSVDIELLARHFLDEANREEGTSMKFAVSVLEKLRMHDWPGNVRELKNTVQRMRIMASGEVIDAAHMSQEEKGAVKTTRPANSDGLVGLSLAEVERRVILATLERYKTREEAAQILGISLKTLYNRLHEYGVHVNGRSESSVSGIANR